MFLATFLIMLREGLEASLIISIIASYLNRTGNQHWMKYVWLGVTAAVGLCVVAGVILFVTVGEMPQRSQELFEGSVALIAVAVLTYMIFWMRKASRSLKDSLASSIDSALNQSKGQGLMMVGMAFFALAREGLESLFFLFSFFEQDGSHLLALSGAILGVVVAILLGVAIYKGSVHLDLRRFFKYTGLLILFVAAGLLAGALKSFHEAGLWNGLQTIVFDASDTFMSTHTVLGSVLMGLFGYNDHPTVGELVVYFAYLIPALIFFFWPAKKQAI
ncbi:iron uptake transporter permease EfeU [Neisseriaceae bacterium CLB008]